MGLIIVVEGTAVDATEARVFSLVLRGDIVEDAEDEVGAGFVGDEVKVDFMEGVLCCPGKGHALEERGMRGIMLTHPCFICTSLAGFECLNSLIASSAKTSSFETHWLSESG